MRLVNKKTNQTIVEFNEKETFIYNKFLEQEMRNIGIPIPHGLRGVYHGKESIHLGDVDFQRAFREVYYVTVINSESFMWID